MVWVVWQHAIEVAMFAPVPPERNLVAAAFEGGIFGRALQERAVADMRWVAPLGGSKL